MSSANWRCRPLARRAPSRSYLIAGPFLNGAFRMILRRIAAPLILLACASPALAHTGHGASGLVHGFAHPLGGIDHELAMQALGLSTAMNGWSALWLVPTA